MHECFFFVFMFKEILLGLTPECPPPPPEYKMTSFYFGQNLVRFIDEFPPPPPPPTPLIPAHVQSKSAEDNSVLLSLNIPYTYVHIFHNKMHEPTYEQNGIIDPPRDMQHRN